MRTAEPYLNVDDVLARYRISRWTLQKMIKEKGFPKPTQFSRRRRYFKALEVEAWDRLQFGDALEIVPEALGMPIVSDVIQTYEDFVKAMRNRRNALDLPANEADALGGMEEGYTNKLENYGKPYGRGMGVETFPRWLGGMRVGIVLVALPRRPHAKRKRASTARSVEA
ncbi:helix-turn-helix transcriptional regulator [Agrobacterium tumefaciens]|uniref:helix-turn-helix transcriptional regulator n=1 Tax=Agrobacterium tumefaciens TaxID=358 RepID=UPI003B9FA415